MSLKYWEVVNFIRKYVTSDEMSLKYWDLVNFIRKYVIGIY